MNAFCNIRTLIAVFLFCSPIESFAVLNTNISSNKGFIKNNGQVFTTEGTFASQVLYKLSSNQLDIYLTKTGIKYVFKEIKGENIFKSRNPYDSIVEAPSEVHYHTIAVDIQHANKDYIVEPQEVIQENITFYGGSYSNGSVKTSSFRRVVYKNVYPNIDWHIYLNETNNLKYDFVVRKGGNPKDIQLKYDGIDEIQHGDNGTVAHFQKGLLEDKDLFVYQESNNTKSIISAKISRKGHVVGYKIGTYNKDADLVIDPYVTWSTYFGGSQNETSSSIVIDSQDRIIISGATLSTNFPTISLGGAYNDLTQNGNSDVYLAMFDKNGVQLWTVYIGGSGNEYPFAWLGRPLALDNNENILLTGYTNSTNFPVQNLSGAYNQSNNAGGNDAFIIKFSSSGSLLWSTYMGGSGADYGNAIRTNSGGKLFFGGLTFSTDFPLKNWTGAYNQTSNYVATNIGGNGGFIAAFDSLTFDLSWSSYFTGSYGSFVAEFIFDSSNNFFVLANSQYYGLQNMPVLNPGGGAYYQSTANSGAYDTFIAKFSPKGVLTWGTYFGGNNPDGLYWGEYNKYDNTIYISGCGGPSMSIQNRSGAYNKSTCTGSRDNAIAQFSLSGQLLWSTYFGGTETSLNDQSSGITITSDSSIWVPGITNATNFPVTSDGTFFQSTNAGLTDLTITRFDKNGSMKYSTYFGGTGSEGYTGASNIAHNSKNEIFYHGYTNSPCNNFPLYNPGNNAFFNGILSGGYDSFITKFSNASVAGSNVGCIALDLNSINLTAQLLENSNIKLIWTFIGDINSNNFIIESSIEGKFWELMASSNSIIPDVTKNTFEMMLNRKETYNYFRIKQLSSSGKYIYSNVAYLAPQKSYVEIFPNPTDGKVNYKVNSQNESKLQLKILNNIGLIIKEVDILSESGIIYLENLSSGLYFIEIWSNEQMIEKSKISII